MITRQTGATLAAFKARQITLSSCYATTIMLLGASGAYEPTRSILSSFRVSFEGHFSSWFSRVVPVAAELFLEHTQQRPWVQGILLCPALSYRTFVWKVSVVPALRQSALCLIPVQTWAGTQQYFHKMSDDPRHQWHHSLLCEFSMLPQLTTFKAFKKSGHRHFLPQIMCPLWRLHLSVRCTDGRCKAAGLEC